MLAAGLVEAADHSPVEQAPDGLHGVGVNVATDLFVGVVVDRGVNGVFVSDGVVAGTLLVGPESPSAYYGIHDRGD